MRKLDKKESDCFALVRRRSNKKFVNLSKTSKLATKRIAKSTQRAPVQDCSTADNVRQERLTAGERNTDDFFALLRQQQKFVICQKLQN
jgi:hypothetical protein